LLFHSLPSTDLWMEENGKAKGREHSRDEVCIVSVTRTENYIELARERKHHSVWRRVSVFVAPLMQLASAIRHHNRPTVCAALPCHAGSSRSLVIVWTALTSSQIRCCLGKSVSEFCTLSRPV